jgi:ribose transport system substrate-binding protein
MKRCYFHVAPVEDFAMRKSLLLLNAFVLSCSLLFAACGAQGTALNPGNSSGPKTIKQIGLTVQAISNPFFVAMQQGAQAEAKKIGAQVILEDANHDVGTQSNQIDDFVQKHVDLILLNAADSAGIAPAVQRAVQAGIPVIAIDVGAQGGVAATVESNNVQAGQLACQYIADRLKGQGTIAIADGPPVTSVQDRMKGCNEVLAKNPGLKLVSHQVGTGDRDKGLEIGNGILTANPHLDAVFAINDPTGLGVMLAAQQAKRHDFFLTAVDGSPDAVTALKAHGIFAATSAQSPFTMAESAVQLGEKIVAGQKPSSSTILIPVTLVTQDNVNSYPGWLRQ